MITNTQGLFEPNWPLLGPSTVKLQAFNGVNFQEMREKTPKSFCNI